MKDIIEKNLDSSKHWVNKNETPLAVSDSITPKSEKEEKVVEDKFKKEEKKINGISKWWDKVCDKYLYGFCIIATIYIYSFVWEQDFVLIFLICLVPGIAPLLLFSAPIIWFYVNVIGEFSFLN